MANNPRNEIIRNKAKGYEIIAKILGWRLVEVRENLHHSYMVYKVERDVVDEGENALEKLRDVEQDSAIVDCHKIVAHKFAILYSQSTDRTVYNTLEREVECIFIQGMSYESNNSFSRDCKICVIPEAEFIDVLTDWNMEFLGEVPDNVKDIEKSIVKQARTDCENDIINENLAMKKTQEYIRIVEENPLEQIYTQLKALTSKSVARKSVESYADKKNINLNADDIENKAEGVSYLVQNAIDYYDNASTENITQRMLNLYYGTVAFMEAEMLVEGDKHKALSEIEKVTKNGHGMMTFGNAECGLQEFYVGVLNKGLFQAWLSHRNIDVSGFPNAKKDVERSGFYISLNELLYCIPELENILLEVDDGFRPGYLFPSTDMTLNHPVSLNKGKYYRKKFPGSYVNMLDLTNRADESTIKDIPGNITVIGPYRDRHDGTTGWRTFVRTVRDGGHFNSYRTHKGLSASMILKSLFGLTNEWDVYSVMILYAFSIIVRYMPNLWNRILHGDLDRYKAVIYQFSRVAERELTQIFLEKLTGKHVIISHPQGLV
jgi:hypothetical protein